MESEQAPPIKETKPKRQLTEGQLEQLAKAREKANAVRKRNADMKRKEKELGLPRGLRERPETCCSALIRARNHPHPKLTK